MKKFLFPLLFLLLSVSILGGSLEIPDRAPSRFNDFVGLFSEQSRVEMEERLARFEETTGCQLFVVFFGSLGGADVEQFSIDLAEKWKTGFKDQDNGLILLVALEERKIRLEVGYGLEGRIPDITARSLIDNEMAPSFRGASSANPEGYLQGVRNITDALEKAVKGEYQPRQRRAGKSGGILLLKILFILFFLLIMGGRGRGLMGVAGYTIGSMGSGRGSRWGGGGWGGGGWGGGGGFSGGGGGSFGGGGATGSW